jgi:hypothetical protein
MTKDKTITKLCAEKLRHNDRKEERLKDEKPNWTSKNYYRVIDKCKGHQCNFIRAASRAYK